MGKGQGGCNDGRQELLVEGAELVEDKDGVTTYKIDPAKMKDKEALKAEMEKIKKQKEALAAEMKKARDELIAKVIKEKGEGALHNINPLALKVDLVDGTDTEAPDILLQPCVEVSVTVNPLLDAALQKLGAVRRQKRTYSVLASKDMPLANFRGILQALPERLYTKERWERLKLGKNGGHSSASEAGHTRFELANTTLGNQLHYNMVYDLTRDSGHYNYAGHQHAATVVSRKDNELTFKIMTQKNKGTKTLELYKGAPNLHQLREEHIEDPVKVSPHVAFSLIGQAIAMNMGIQVDPEVEKLRTPFKQAVLARPVPGSPGEAEVIIGESVKGVKPPKGYAYNELPGETGAKGIRLPAQLAGQLVEDAGASNSEVINMLDPAVEDVIRMEQAPKLDIDGLMPYQNEAVSLHLSTNIGFLNACAPGLGKTPMTLTGCRLKWEDAEKAKRPYRALIGAPKSLTGQWLSEVGRFFPNAQVFNLTTTNIRECNKKLQMHELSRPAYPLLVIGSYQAVRKGYDEGDLGFWEWDDLIIDESDFLKGGSKIKDTFWKLRERAKCAVALTGTPIDKGLDDIGSILSWVRNDPSLFHSEKLSDRFNIAHKAHLENLWKAIGPVVFRRDRSEIKDQLPKLVTEVMMLEPHKTEKDLAEGSKNELKKILLDMEEAIEKQIKLINSHKNKNTDDLEALEEAKEQLRSMRGTVMAGMQLARMAASDPAAVGESESVAAALLDQAGLVEPAVKQGGTKRKKMSEYVKDQVAKGESVLIFTDFASVATSLEEELSEAGIKVGSFKGGQTNANRDKSKELFQGTPCKAHRSKPGAVKTCKDCNQPELDVLVLTKAAKVGLNLQRASTLIHYDLSWVPSDFVQRTGRASRFGSDNEQVKLVIPLMEDTIEERVASVLVPRAMKAMMALDSVRGADISDNELSGLSREVANKLGDGEVNDEDKGIFEIAKKLVLEN